MIKGTKIRVIGGIPRIKPPSQVTASFSPTAVMLTSGTSYTVPTGATSMKVWAVGAGLGTNYSGWGFITGRAGTVTYKTWSVSGGQTIYYSMPTGGLSQQSGPNTTVTFGSTTITAWNGYTAPILASPNDIDKYSGQTYLQLSKGDGLVFGGGGGSYGSYTYRGGAIGGNSASACGNNVMTDVSGLKAALTLAGVNHTNNCTEPAPFGRGARTSKFSGSSTAGIGGGSVYIYEALNPGGPAVVIYFT